MRESKLNGVTNIAASKFIAYMTLVPVSQQLRHEPVTTLVLAQNLDIWDMIGTRHVSQEGLKKGCWHYCVAMAVHIRQPKRL
jgi:hypothetical protein